jgi:hypothetical protein
MSSVALRDQNLTRKYHLRKADFGDEQSHHESGGIRGGRGGAFEHIEHGVPASFKQ